MAAWFMKVLEVDQANPAAHGLTGEPQINSSTSVRAIHISCYHKNLSLAFQVRLSAPRLYDMERKLIWRSNDFPLHPISFSVVQISPCCLVPADPCCYVVFSCLGCTRSHRFQ
ncbi:hypothetical protein GGI35DRAFT_74328 [Trichoderma velutinum]